MNSIYALAFLGVLCLSLGGVRCDKPTLAFENPAGGQYRQEDLDLSNDVFESSDSLIKPFIEPSGGRQRFKRSNTRLQTIEVFVITDFSVYNKWLNISNGDANLAIENLRSHIASVFIGVNNIFANIQNSSFDYRVRVTEISIATRATDSPYTENLLNAENRLDLVDVFMPLRAWFRANYVFPHTFDVAVTYTSYQGDGPMGIAQTSSACSPGLSVIRDNLISGDIITTAHEIAHTLSAVHDEQGNDCFEADNFIMKAVQSGFEATAQIFSSCSISEMDSFVHKLIRNNQNCFRVEAHRNPINLANLALQRPGTRFSLDQQCQMLYGLDSYYGSTGGNTHTDICSEMYCWDASTGFRSRQGNTKAYDGSTCGNQRWCDAGSCVFDEAAPANDGFCLYGDSTSILTVNGLVTDCADIERTLCYNAAINDHCCQTCSSMASDDPTCRFGDTASNCLAKLAQHPGACSIINKDGYCCESCSQA